MPGQGSLAVVNLCLFSGQKLKPVILLRLFLAQCPNKTLYAVVSAGKPELLDQVLIHGYGIPAQLHLLFYPLPVLFTG
jgi:hypothetical protein